MRDLPGQRLAYTQPIKLRMDELGTGSRSDIAVKLYGDDLETLAETPREIEQVLLTVDGAADVGATQLTGQPMLQIKIRPRRNRPVRDSGNHGVGCDSRRSEIALSAMFFRANCDFR